MEEWDGKERRKMDIDLLDSFEKKLALHTSIEEEKFREISEEIKEVKEQIQELLNLWEQAKGIVTFVKAASWIVSTLAAIWFFFKDHIK